MDSAGSPEASTLMRFGDQLRQERESRGMRLQEISATTKVSLQSLQALEAGEYGQLPGGVFRRGIVRSYLNALGLDEAGWMARFEESCRAAGQVQETDGDWVQFAENVRRGRGLELRAMGWRWMGVLALLGAICIAAWLAWHYVIRGKMPLREVGESRRLGFSAELAEHPSMPGYIVNESGNVPTSSDWETG